MTQDNGGRGPEDSADSSFFHRLGAFFRDESEDGDAAKQLQSAMQNARAKGVIGEDSFSMMEGVLKISELCASDIMIPRSRIKAINLDEPREQWMREARESGHSRFPVIDGDFSNVIGL
ncbi:MAG: magnesium/cobalt efflux protein, partial [Mesosutterella sp.]|nr:magnesium/cobalt efflux protein [Mesosutterella sp.]